MYGEFFEDGKLLKNGFVMSKDMQQTYECKNGEPVSILRNTKFDEEKNMISAIKLNVRKKDIILAEK